MNIDKAFSRVNLVIMGMGVMFMILLAFDQEWFDVVTWFFISLTSYFNYRSIEDSIKTKELLDARIEEIMNDYRG